MADYLTFTYLVFEDLIGLYYVELVTKSDPQAFLYWLGVVASILGLAVWRYNSCFRRQVQAEETELEETRDEVVQNLSLNALMPHASHGRITDLKYIDPLPPRFLCFTNFRPHLSRPYTKNYV